MEVRAMDELLDWKQLARAVGGDPPPRKKTLRRWMDAGILPQPLRLGPATLRWRASEVRAALKKLPHGRGIWKVRRGRPPKNRPEFVTQPPSASD
jgi:predicted DNA-binding transcriptional regulator AlpA